MTTTTARSEITSRAPMHEGNGSSRTWQRTINGTDYSFTAVLMPNGERRYFASKLTGTDKRFACDWTHCFEHFVKPAMNHNTMGLFVVSEYQA